MRTIEHEEIGGGYSGKRKIIINACELSTGEFEAMALYDDGDELAGYTTSDEDSIIKAFYDLVMRFAGPLQKAVYSANLVSGGKYTLAYYSDFGFPVTQKITLHSVQLTTYAQYSDCVRLAFIPYRKRTIYAKAFYDTSFLIFKGWQDLPKNFGFTVERESPDCIMKRSNYACFDSRYIDDLEKTLKNPAVVYKNYKTGASGKIYA